MGRIGTTEILLIIVAILILFGGKRIPELMRSLGSGVREFKKGMEEGETNPPSTGAQPTSEQKPPSDTKPEK